MKGFDFSGLDFTNSALREDMRVLIVALHDWRTKERAYVEAVQHSLGDTEASLLHQGVQDALFEVRVQADQILS